MTSQAFTLHWSTNLSHLHAILLPCGILSTTEPTVKELDKEQGFDKEQVTTCSQSLHMCN